MATEEIIKTAQAEVEVGKHYWIVFRDLLRCPVCGRYFKDAYDFDNYDAYCRHCGTRMDGIKNG